MKRQGADLARRRPPGATAPSTRRFGSRSRASSRAAVQRARDVVSRSTPTSPGISAMTTTIGLSIQGQNTERATGQRTVDELFAARRASGEASRCQQSIWGRGASPPGNDGAESGADSAQPCESPVSYLPPKCAAGVVPVWSGTSLFARGYMACFPVLVYALSTFARVPTIHSVTPSRPSSGARTRSASSRR